MASARPDEVDLFTGPFRERFDSYELLQFSQAADLADPKITDNGSLAIRQCSAARRRYASRDFHLAKQSVSPGLGKFEMFS